MPTTAFEGFKSGNTIIPCKDVSAFPRSEQAVLGAKNLLPNKAVSTTTNGITYTVNKDGSVIANGTQDGTGDGGDIFLCRVNHATYRYKVSDFPNLSESILSMGINRDDKIYLGIWYFDANGSFITSDIVSRGHSEIKLNPPTNADTFCPYIRVEKNKTVDNVTLYPMIRLATDTDDTYVPYAMTNRELTENKVDRKAPTATDCNAFTDHFMSITSATLNSAQKQGLATAGNGFLITAFMQNTWNVQFIFSYDGHIYKRTVDGTADNWTQWALVA